MNTGYSLTASSAPNMNSTLSTNRTPLVILMCLTTIMSCKGLEQRDFGVDWDGGARADLTQDDSPDTTPPDTTPPDDGPLPSDASTAPMDADADETPQDAATPDEPDPALAPDPRAHHEDQVIYLIMPDRFANGDPDNDNAGAPDCLDPGHPRRFHGGDLAGLRQRLDYLDDLGVNTVWTTPLTRQIGRHFDSCGYHGYWADLTIPDDDAFEPRLGDAATFDALLSEMDRRGMGFILDMVVNHVGYGARLVSQRPQWFHSSDCADLGDPEVTCPLAGLPDLAQERSEVADYLNAHSAGWTRRHALAGIRMDTIKHIPIDYLAQQWVPTVRDARPGLFLVGEHLSDQSLALYDPYLDAGFDSLFNFRLRTALVTTLAQGGDLSTLADRVRETMAHFGLEQALKMTNLLDNHDVPRFVHELQGDDAQRARRYHMAMSVLMTLPGIPQIYYGNELGMDGGGDPDNRRDMPSWAFTPGGPDTTQAPGFVGDPARNFALTRALLQARAQHPALRRGDYFELWRPPAEDAPPLFAFLRTLGDDRLLIVVHNGTTPSGATSIPVADHAFLTDELKAALTDRSTLQSVPGTTVQAPLQIINGAIELAMPPLSVGVWTF